MGKNGSHNKSQKKLNNIFKLLSESGYNVIPTKHGYKIIHIETNDIHSYHPSAYDKGYHPLRRWVYHKSNLII